MGRRKKEPESVHREAIARAAERLFAERGLDAATMDDIARESGYSKATLYVYFRGKEELTAFLVQRSMELLRGCLAQAASQPVPIREKYDGICLALARYQARCPLYFSLALGEINVDPARPAPLEAERETYETGEQINHIVADFLREGMDAGVFRPDLPVLQTVFLFWGALSGVVLMAANKRAYLAQAAGLTQQALLTYSFGQLYRMISREGTP